MPKQPTIAHPRQISRRRLRRSLGTRTTRRRGTKHNGGFPQLQERPAVRMKHFVSLIYKGEKTMDDLVR